MKNYIGFVNDHSGSMGSLATAATKDYNATITAFRDAANEQMLDTVVSVVGIGLSDGGYGVKRQVVISNPHVLKPITAWPTPGGTPLWDGIGNMIELFESLPDAQDENVSFLVLTTTDGREEHSTKYDTESLAAKIKKLQATGRWTFVFRVPSGLRRNIEPLGVPLDNIQEWNTTAAGMAQSTAQTQTAVKSFYAARSAGTKSSTSFYTSAASVNVNALTDISKEVSLYVVPANAGRLEIKDFILSKRSQYLKGAAFYQLVKTEARVGPEKIILIRERNAPNRIFAGKEAREMLNLPTDPTSNARVHPGDHGNYDIFIQSTSLNRLLPAGTGVLYWEKQGVPFTQADIEKFAPKAPAPAPAAPVLPAVVGRTKPTPSPVPKAAPAPAYRDYLDGKPVQWFEKRDDARKVGSVKDARVVAPGAKGPNGERWFIYL